MKRLLTLCIILLVFVAQHAYAQQVQQYSLYQVDPFLVNPAISSTEDFIDVKSGRRSQWQGFSGSPKTTFLSLCTTLGKNFNSSHNHSKYEHQSWHGIGGYIFDDQTGPLRNTSLSLSYSYNQPLTNKIRLSSGVFVGSKSINYNPTGLRVSETHDHLLVASRFRNFTMSFGSWLYTDNFYVGVSALQAITTAPSQESGIITGKLIPHFNFMTGYNMSIG
jgi:type IX secretion system PorP/SprF family membrane protein